MLRGSVLQDESEERTVLMEAVGAWIVQRSEVGRAPRNSRLYQISEIVTLRGFSNQHMLLIQHGERRRFAMLRYRFAGTSMRSRLRGLREETKDGPQARRLLALGGDL